MKITEYAALEALTEENVLLTDGGTTGTRKMLATDAFLSMLHLVSPENHRMVYRGKNLGNTLTAGQKAAIQAGTFEDLWLGDYWEIGGVKWVIADFDYWYNVGDTAFSSHHLAIIPEGNLYTGKMNTASVTTGAYAGSEMYTTGLASAKATVQSAFGTNLLTHREYLTNAMTSGYPSGGAWADSQVDLMNEPMITGAYIHAPASNGQVIPKRYTASQKQLALFRVNPKLVNTTLSGQRISYWLRDPLSENRFARVTDYGPVTETAPSLEYGVRPIFAIG